MKTRPFPIPRTHHVMALLLAAFALHCGDPSTGADQSPADDAQIADGGADVGLPEQDAGPDTVADAGADAGPVDVSGGDVGLMDGAGEDSTASLPDAADVGSPDVTDSVGVDVTDASTADVTDAGAPDASDVSVVDVTDASVVDVTDAGAPDVTDGGTPDVTDVAVSDVTDAGAPDVTDAETPDAEPSDAADAAPDGGPVTNPACANPKPVPIPFTTVAGFGGSEDFAMDYEGNVVLNKGGSIARVSPSGAIHIVAPNAGATAGISVLSNNDIVFCAGDKLKIAYVSGGYDTIIAGLSYPNGMDVDHEDFVYVAEQSGGRLRRVNPYTGEFQIIADKLPNPNGVAWAPGYKRVYVGSFGGGTVHYIDRLPDGEWSQPVLFAKIDGDATVTGPPPEPIDPPPVIYLPCDGKAAADPCITGAGWQGACEDTGGAGLHCVPLPDALPPEEAACVGASTTKIGCAISILGFSFHGKCINGGFSPDCCVSKSAPGCGLPTCEECICAADPYCCDSAWDGICVDETASICPIECNCDQSAPIEGAAVCYTQPSPTAYCAGMAEGDICAFIKDADTIIGGKCTDVTGLGLGAPYPAKGIACVPPDAFQTGGGGGGGGGLDGLNVDECGTVYVTEYVLGYLWRITPEGAITKAAKLSSWIPNIDFGRGVGGWPKTTMYVMDFTKDQLFALDIGVEGKWAVPPLP